MGLMDRMWRRKPPEEETEFYDVKIEEISLVDAGDNQGSNVVFYKRHDSAGEEFEKIVRSEIAKSRTDIDEATALALADAVLSEISELPDRGDDAAIKAAVLKAVAKWAATPESPPTPAPANDGPPVTQTKRRAPYFTKRSEVMDEVGRLAKAKMSAEPNRYASVAAARASVWADRPDLVDSYYNLPETPETPAAEPDVIAKTAGQSAGFREINAEAQKLVRESGYTLSESEARNRVAKARPDLAEVYYRELRAASS